jgi:hypothetical protein
MSLLTAALAGSSPGASRLNAAASNAIAASLASGCLCSCFKRLYEHCAVAADAGVAEMQVLGRQKARDPCPLLRGHLTLTTCHSAGGLQAAARSMADSGAGPQASLSSPPRPATAAGYLRGSTAPSYCLAATKTRRRRGRRPGVLHITTPASDCCALHSAQRFLVLGAKLGNACCAVAGNGCRHPACLAAVSRRAIQNAPVTIRVA